MFKGIFTCPLDEKSRAVLPLRLRDVVPNERLRDGFVITQGFEGCLMMFLRADWEELESSVQKLRFTDPTARLFLRFFVSPATPVSIDRVGRMTINDSHREIAGIKREVVFNGTGNFIEVWSPETWQQYRTDNVNRYEEAAASLQSGLFTLGGGGEESKFGDAKMPQ